MDRDAPQAGGVTTPTISAAHAATSSTQPLTPTSSTQQPSSDKGKAPIEATAKPPAPQKEQGKGVASSSTKKGKLTTPASGKKRKKVTKRKPDANKSAGIQTRRCSPAWDVFRKVPEDEVSEPTAECIYCGIRFLCGTKTHGTSNLLAHIPKCPKYAHGQENDPKQKILAFDSKSSGKQLSGAISGVVDLKECRKAIAMFVLCDEQPFKVVEGFGFKSMCHKLCPKLEVPCRKTIATDCYQIYLQERDRLKALLRSDCHRVCLTTDCWTSVQNLNYMSLTAHFIDNEWKLHKRILNFIPIPNHRGETIGKAIESCLNEWGLKRVFSVTVDNATSNDTALAYLKKKVRNWNGLVQDGDMMHMRCCAHILNLVVTEGLKDYNVSISAVRNVVKYVKSSPARLARFKDAASVENISYKGGLCLDVPTRWNSTYKMLDSAQKYLKAFERLEEEDRDFQIFFDESERRGAPPTNRDWDNVRALTEFLKTYNDVTLAFSSSLHVTSSSLYTHISLVESQLKSCTSVHNLDSVFYFMATEMRTKFDKYWGMLENMNPLIFIANALDPRYKMAYITWSFEEIYGEEFAMTMVARVKTSLVKLYEWYANEYGKLACGGSGKVPSQGETSSHSASTFHKARAAAFLQHLKKKDTIEASNELERYLIEPCSIEQGDKFDVLDYWRTNASRLVVLSKMARDVLAVPVSTVASESAFSTGGRVLDVFRSSLAPKTVEALICTQDWLRPRTPSKREQPVMDDMDPYEDLHTEVAAGPSQGGGNGGQSTISSAGGEDSNQESQPMVVD